MKYRWNDGMMHEASLLSPGHSTVNMLDRSWEIDDISLMIACITVLSFFFLTQDVFLSMGQQRTRFLTINLCADFFTINHSSFISSWEAKNYQATQGTYSTLKQVYHDKNQGKPHFRFYKTNVNLQQIFTHPM